jgi:hypothetical protein
VSGSVERALQFQLPSFFSPLSFLLCWCSPEHKELSTRWSLFTHLLPVSYSTLPYLTLHQNRPSFHCIGCLPCFALPCFLSAQQSLARSGPSLATRTLRCPLLASSLLACLLHVTLAFRRSGQVERNHLAHHDVEQVLPGLYNALHVAVKHRP